MRCRLCNWLLRYLYMGILKLSTGNRLLPLKQTALFLRGRPLHRVYTPLHRVYTGQIAVYCRQQAENSALHAAFSSLHTAFTPPPTCNAAFSTEKTLLHSRGAAPPENFQRVFSMLVRVNTHLLPENTKQASKHKYHRSKHKQQAPEHNLQGPELNQQPPNLNQQGLFHENQGKKNPLQDYRGDNQN